jgi:predicted nucleotidyltransferase
MDTADILDTIKRALPDVRAIYLFGSRAEGEARSESDIDIAVLPRSPLSELERYDLAQALAARLNRDVDLLDLESASTVVRMQVIARGERLYPAVSRDLELFEDFVFADYARLNEERAGILADIRARGSVHGR